MQIYHSSIDYTTEKLTGNLASLNLVVSPQYRDFNGIFYGTNVPRKMRRLASQVGIFREYGHLGVPVLAIH